MHSGLVAGIARLEHAQHLGVLRVTETTEPDSRSAGEETARLECNPTFDYRVYISPPLVPVQSTRLRSGLRFILMLSSHL